MFRMGTAVSMLLMSLIIACKPVNQLVINEQKQAEIDQFAITHLDKVQRLSIRDNIEYCGLLIINSVGEISATKAQAGDRDSCEIDSEFGEDTMIVASYHTHGAYSLDADTEVPSIDDLEGDFEEGIDGYISTPAGRVWVNRVEDEKSYLLCDTTCVIADPDFKACPRFLPAKSYTIETLEQREENDTGEC